MTIDVAVKSRLMAEDSVARASFSDLAAPYTSRSSPRFWSFRWWILIFEIRASSEAAIFCAKYSLSCSLRYVLPLDGKPDMSMSWLVVSAGLSLLDSYAMSDLLAWRWLFCLSVREIVKDAPAFSASLRRWARTSHDHLADRPTLPPDHQGGISLSFCLGWFLDMAITNCITDTQSCGWSIKRKHWALTKVPWKRARSRYRLSNQITIKPSTRHARKWWWEHKIQKKNKFIDSMITTSQKSKGKLTINARIVQLVHFPTLALFLRQLPDLVLPLHRLSSSRSRGGKTGSSNVWAKGSSSKFWSSNGRQEQCWHDDWGRSCWH